MSSSESDVAADTASSGWSRAWAGDGAAAERVADEVSGLGLGLYIARSIVEQLGGTLRAEQNSAQGLCLVIKIPLASQKQAGSP